MMRMDGRTAPVTEGFGAFYRGMGTKVTQTVFAAALMFAAKEEIAKAVRLAHAKMVLKQKKRM